MKDNDAQKTFYEKFVKKNTVNTKESQSADKKNDISLRKKQNKKAADKKETFFIKTQRTATAAKTRITGAAIFHPLDGEAAAVLNSFDEIVRSAVGLNSKQEALIPKDIRSLFHELTDERGMRKINYLNNPRKLTAYMYHYMWWNLVRIVKLILNMNFDLYDGSSIADFGCGPLTMACAFWIAKPELRKKKLHWYCADISGKALSAGEAIFNSLCAFTEKDTQQPCSPWKITKVTGSFGVPLKSEIDFFISANMFNEIFWDSSIKISGEAEKAVKNIIRYLKNKREDFDRHNSSRQVLIIEPGIPLAGAFISELRRLLLKNDFIVVSPCPHNCVCPIPGQRQEKTNGLDGESFFKKTSFLKRPQNGGGAFAQDKWCHFSFYTDDAPKKLVVLSEAAKLEKTRASLSFVYCKSKPTKYNEAEYCASAAHAKETFNVRITSDIIKLQDGIIGRYACSEKGFLLLTEKNSAASTLKTYMGGSLVKIRAHKINPFLKDKKTGAIIIKV